MKADWNGGSMKKKILLGAMCVIMGIYAGENSAYAQYANDESIYAEWYDEESGKYKYPITPKSDEWKEFTTHQQMIDACTIPEALLEQLSTEELYELVMDSLILDIYCFNTKTEGFEVVKQRFNGLQELLQRKDVSEF